jgi:phosphoribosyl 1,2-cyclic phosphodiesterase
MSLMVCSIASGSNGNCYYIGNQDEAVLVDIGISCKEMEKRMLRLNLSMSKVKGIFISHEHSDHIYGLAAVAKKFGLPVYSTAATISRCRITSQQTHSFQFHDLVRIGNLSITAFPKFHDAVEPCSFTVQCNDTRVGVFTDIGKACGNVIRHFSQCHAAFLETNYDDTMLANGSYPRHLKSRISGDQGHLSNRQALELFRQHRSDGMTHLFLSHLSKNNNCPVLAQKTFESEAGNTKIILASREAETALYHITAKGQQPVRPRHPGRPAQLELAFG